MSGPDDRLHAVRVSAAAGRHKRTEIARLRADMMQGRRAWQDVIMDPPACVHGLFLSELLLQVPYMQRHRVEVLAEKAFADGITLVVRCDRASTRTREWIVENLFPRGPVARGRARPRHAGRRGGMRTGVLLT